MSRVAPAKRGMTPEGTPPEVDLALARGRGEAQGFAWSPYEKASFERAKREHKLVLIDGAAAWCHWCHVMDATTYRDAEVGRVLAQGFVTIRVDIDARPDLAERYGEWGWPATILLDADGRELGKLRGFVPKKELLAALETARNAALATREEARPWAARGASVDELGWVVAHTAFELDAFYDAERGGWGRRQKAPLGANLELEARRAADGDGIALARVRQTGEAQRALIDPVWGGLYQYSDGGGWGSPHFEKLTALQAENLAGYAAAYAATRDPKLKADGERVASYLIEHMRGTSGAFFTSQDADVAAHDEARDFVDGHVFYALGDAERRAIGAPRVDQATFPFENGLTIGALVALHDATADRRWLDAARGAADAMLASCVEKSGVVHRGGEGARRVTFLADAAALGWGLSELARATQEPRYRDAAVGVIAAVERTLRAQPGGYYGNTVDPDAVGVLAERRRPFEANVLYARALASLAALTGDGAHRARGVLALATAATPEALAAQGRMLGGFLLAARELGIGPDATPRAPAPVPGVD